MKPKISIIIPCYNVQNYLGHCLESIINQTFSDFEVVCINDGSTDKTLDVIQTYAKKDPRIKVFNQENKGLSESRSLGIKYATADFIMYVDGDDWLELDCLESLVNTKDDYDIVAFSYTRDFKKGSIPKKIGLAGEYNANLIQQKIVGPIGDELKIVENIDALVPVWGKLYKSEMIKDMKFHDINQIGTWEDGLFNLQVLEKANKVFVIDRPLYHYRKTNQNSFTNSNRKDLYKKWLFKFSLIQKLILNKDQNFHVALQNRIAISTLGLLLSEVNNNNSILIKLKGIKNILSDNTYHKALKNLNLSSMALHWKLFYTFAKYKCVKVVFLMSKAILFLINRKN